MQTSLSGSSLPDHSSVYQRNLQDLIQQKTQVPSDKKGEIHNKIAELLRTQNPLDHSLVNTPLPDGTLPLHKCIQIGDQDLVKLMLEHGAHPFQANDQLSNAFDTAIHYKQEAILAILEQSVLPKELREKISEQAKSTKIFSEECEALSVDILKKKFTYSFSNAFSTDAMFVNSPALNVYDIQLTPQAVAIRILDTPAFKFYEKNAHGLNRIQQAIVSGDFALAHHLLLIHMHIRKQLKELIDNGMKVLEIGNSTIQEMIDEGRDRTAINALEREQITLAESTAELSKLMPEPIEFWETPEGDNIFHLAARSGDLNMMHYLAHMMPPNTINKRNKEGQTPLHLFACNPLAHSGDFFQFLAKSMNPNQAAENITQVKNQADIFIKDKKGASAYDYLLAKEYQHAKEVDPIGVKEGEWLAAGAIFLYWGLSLAHSYQLLASHETLQHYAPEMLAIIGQLGMQETLSYLSIVGLPIAGYAVGNLINSGIPLVYNAVGMVVGLPISLVRGGIRWVLGTKEPATTALEAANLDNHQMPWLLQKLGFSPASSKQTFFNPPEMTPWPFLLSTVIARASHAMQEYQGCWTFAGIRPQESAKRALLTTVKVGQVCAVFCMNASKALFAVAPPPPPQTLYEKAWRYITG